MTSASVGPYQILEKLGVGGMGEVFLGHDPRLERRVALKCLTTKESESPEGRARILREGRAAARLTHPNIAGVYDVLEEDGHTYIVMEYVEGISLAAHIAGGPRPSREVREVGRQLASALAAAHAQGVIHRDLKPANIQVTSDGSIKVLDFGVAKLTAPVLTGAETTSGEAVVDKTIAGNPGTPVYMAPEQLMSRPIDARADIYSTGVVLYLMATGRRPYEETTAVNLALAMTAGPPPAARSINPLVPLELSEVLAKALERDPAKRYQTAKELDAALAGMESTRQPSSRVMVHPDATTELVASKRREPKRWIWLVAAAVVLAIGLVAGMPVLSRLGFGGERASPSKTIGDAGIAVLPLANLSADPNQEYLADGITEAIIAELGRVRSLRVISRRSVMRYKQTTTSVPQIAKELGVGAVMTGSVSRAGDRLHITIALVQPSPERQLWSETYDRTVADIVTLSDEVAQAALGQLQAVVTPLERAQLSRVRPVKPDAYQAYLLGRYYWNKRTQADVERAIQEFRRAIALDPRSALAYAGLADCFVVAWDNNYLSAQESFREGRANAMKALQLDDTIAEAHASLGAVLSLGLFWPAAEVEFRRALELNPGYATAHQWYAVTLSVLGRHDEAVAEATRALELDPLSAVQNVFLGQRLYYAGDYAASVVQLQKAVALAPQFSFAHAILGRVYVMRGQYGDAIRELEVASKLDGVASGDLGHAYALAGDRAAAERVLAELLRATTSGQGDPYRIGLVYLALGQRDRALDWLSKAYEQAESAIADMAIDPRLAPIAAEPRFVAMLQKSGLRFTPGKPRS